METKQLATKKPMGQVGEEKEIKNKQIVKKI